MKNQLNYLCLHFFKVKIVTMEKIVKRLKCIVQLRNFSRLFAIVAIGAIDAWYTTACAIY